MNPPLVILIVFLSIFGLVALTRKGRARMKYFFWDQYKKDGRDV